MCDMKKGVIVKIIIAAILIVVGTFGCVYNIIFCYRGDLKYFGYKDLKVNVTSVRTTEIEGKKYRIDEVKVNGMNKPDANGEYTLCFVTYNGEQCQARLYDNYPVCRFNNPNYFVTKFSYQDGDPMLSSPVFLRWAEIVLNRAEANAKLGNAAAALTDVNAIRTRAGIPAEGMFETGKMHGYDNVLDVVLDERRMELAFEGHRYFDVYRNERDMDRRFPGIHPWEVIPYTADKIQYPIPYVETSVSHIDQNPGY